MVTSLRKIWLVLPGLIVVVPVHPNILRVCRHLGESAIAETLDRVGKEPRVRKHISLLFADEFMRTKVAADPIKRVFRWFGESARLLEMKNEDSAESWRYGGVS